MLATFSLLAALAASAVRPVGLPPAPTVEVDHTEATLRGDWEPPRVVVLVFSEAWADTLLPITQAIAPAADIWLLLEEGSRWATARRFVRGLDPDIRERVHLVRIQTDTMWVRDYGPFELRHHDGSLTWLDNAYIGDRPRDDDVPRRLARVGHVALRALDVAIDGGALASNGRGLCVTTEDYLFSENIDSGDEERLRQLAGALGCKALAAVPALAFEATMHVDPFLQFLAPGRVAIATVASDQSEDDHTRLESVASAVASAAYRVDQALEIVRVPMWVEGDFYYSYINGLQLPDRFIVPAYRDVPLEFEVSAHDALRRAFPHATLVPVFADDLVAAQGVIHCITLGLDVDPRPPRPRRRRKT